MRRSSKPICIRFQALTCCIKLSARRGACLSGLVGADKVALQPLENALAGGEKGGSRGCALATLAFNLSRSARFALCRHIQLNDHQVCVEQRAQREPYQRQPNWPAH